MVSALSLGKISYTNATLTIVIISRHIYMVIAEVVTFMVYIVSMVFLPEYFGEWQPQARSADPKRLTVFCIDAQICRLSFRLDSWGRHFS